MESPLPTKLMEISLHCRRYPTTRHFYTTVLGLPIGKEGRHHCFLDTGGSMRLAIVDASQLGPQALPKGLGTILNLSSDAFPSLRRRLQDNGVRIEQEANDEYGRNITVHDPEGNVVNLFQEGTF